MLVCDIGIDSHCKNYILSVSSYITHTGERLVVGSTADTALICEIIIIWIIPLECYLLILKSVSCSYRPCFVKRIITIHKAYRSVRSAELVQNIVLIYILSPFTSVAEIDSTLCRSHVYLFDVVHKIFPFIFIINTNIINLIIL